MVCSDTKCVSGSINYLFFFFIFFFFTILYRHIREKHGEQRQKNVLVYARLATDWSFGLGWSTRTPRSDGTSCQSAHKSETEQCTRREGLKILLLQRTLHHFVQAKAGRGEGRGGGGGGGVGGGGSLFVLLGSNSSCCNLLSENKNARMRSCVQ